MLISRIIAIVKISSALRGFLGEGGGNLPPPAACIPVYGLQPIGLRLEGDLPGSPC